MLVLAIKSSFSVLLSGYTATIHSSGSTSRYTFFQKS